MGSGVTTCHSQSLLHVRMPAIQCQGRLPAIQFPGRTPAIQCPGRTPAVQCPGLAPLCFVCTPCLSYYPPPPPPRVRGAEYGWLLFGEGKPAAARVHLETALDMLARTGLVGHEPAAAEYHYKLGRWGGSCRACHVSGVSGR